MTETPILNIQNLTKRYRRLVAVDDLTLSIGPGEFVGLIGPNGAGKSTTMNAVAGLLEADEGSIKLCGHSITDDPVQARQRLGYVPQHLHLHGWLTGEEYLRFVASVREVEEAAAARQVEELLAIAELEDARHRLVKEYSGGMIRKLAICGALIAKPDLLLLDESFVGLDPESTWRFRKRLQKHRDEGHAVLLSSHILDMLENICTRIVMLCDGKIVLDETREELEVRFSNGPDKDLTQLYLRLAGKEDLLTDDP